MFLFFLLNFFLKFHLLGQTLSSWIRFSENMEATPTYSYVWETLKITFNSNLMKKIIWLNVFLQPEIEEYFIIYSTYTNVLYNKFISYLAWFDNLKKYIFSHLFIYLWFALCLRLVHCIIKANIMVLKYWRKKGRDIISNFFLRYESNYL